MLTPIRDAIKYRALGGQQVYLAQGGHAMDYYRPILSVRFYTAQEFCVLDSLFALFKEPPHDA